MRRQVALCLALSAWPAAILQQRPPQFRVATDLVTIDVSVRRGRAPVTGLGARDFLVTDNGVAQTIELFEAASLPLDVTVALDTSGSMLSMMEPVRAHMQQSARLLRQGDRMRLLSFADAVSQTSPFQPIGPDFAVPALTGGGMTSMYDGLVAALVPPRDGDRRHVVIAFTDGIDTVSVLNSEALLSVARQSDSVLHLFLVVPGGVRPPPPPPALMHLNTRQIWSPVPVDDGFFALRATARETGGLFEMMYDTPDFPDALRRAIEDFRTSYVLRYRATGVAREGWHKVEVRLTKPRSATVRARRGYFGG